jgi:ribosomal protein S16
MAINPERIQHWIGVGARPSATVAQLLLAYGIPTAKPRKNYRRKAQRLKKAPAKKAAAPKAASKAAKK